MKPEKNTLIYFVPDVEELLEVAYHVLTLAKDNSTKDNAKRSHANNLIVELTILCAHLSKEIDYSIRIDTSRLDKDKSNFDELSHFIDDAVDSLSRISVEHPPFYGMSNLPDVINSAKGLSRYIKMLLVVG